MPTLLDLAFDGNYVDRLIGYNTRFTYKGKLYIYLPAVDKVLEL